MWLAFAGGIVLLVTIVLLLVRAGRHEPVRARAVGSEEPVAAETGGDVPRAAWPVQAGMPPRPAPGGSAPPAPFQGDPVFNPHDLPMSPPLFPDPRSREKYRGWWVQEMRRRVQNYEKLHPVDGGRDYPNDPTTDHLLANLYDAAEVPPPDVKQADMDARVARLRRALDDFRDAFGQVPMTVSSEGDDSRFGPPTVPPILPPGMINGPPPEGPPPPTYIELKPGQHGPMDPAPIGSGR